MCGEKRIGKCMSAAVRQRVRGNWGAEQAQTHDISLNVVSILAIIEERHPVSRLRQIGPLLSANLEFSHIPAGIGMCRSLEMAELNLVCCLLCVNVYGESDLEKFLALLPFHFRRKIDTSRSRIKDDLLFNSRLSKAANNPDGATQGTALDELEFFQPLEDVTPFFVIDVHVPGIPAVGNVTMEVKEIALFAEDLAAGAQIEDTRQVPSGIDFHAQETVLQSDPMSRLGGLDRLVRRVKELVGFLNNDIAAGRNVDAARALRRATR